MNPSLTEYLVCNGFVLGLIAIIITDNPVSEILKAAIQLYLM